MKDLIPILMALTRAQNAMTKGIQALALLKETLRLENERLKQAQLQAPAVDLELTAITASNSAANASTFSGSNAA